MMPLTRCVRSSPKKADDTNKTQSQICFGPVFLDWRGWLAPYCVFSPL
jgi:hypothetical protein